MSLGTSQPAKQPPAQTAAVSKPLEYKVSMSAPLGIFKMPEPPAADLPLGRLYRLIGGVDPGLANSMLVELVFAMREPAAAQDPRGTQNSVFEAYLGSYLDMMRKREIHAALAAGGPAKEFDETTSFKLFAQLRAPRTIAR